MPTEICQHTRNCPDIAAGVHVIFDPPGGLDFRFLPGLPPQLCVSCLSSHHMFKKIFTPAVSENELRAKQWGHPLQPHRGAHSRVGGPFHMASVSFGRTSPLPAHACTREPLRDSHRTRGDTQWADVHTDTTAASHICTPAHKLNTHVHTTRRKATKLPATHRNAPSHSRIHHYSHCSLGCCTKLRSSPPHPLYHTLMVGHIDHLDSFPHTWNHGTSLSFVSGGGKLWFHFMDVWQQMPNKYFILCLCNDAARCIDFVPSCLFI